METSGLFVVFLMERGLTTKEQAYWSLDVVLVATESRIEADEDLGTEWE